MSLPDNIKARYDWGSPADSAYLRRSAENLRVVYRETAAQLLEDIANAIEAAVPLKERDKVKFRLTGREGTVVHVKEDGDAWVSWDNNLGDWVGPVSKLVRA